MSISRPASLRCLISAAGLLLSLAAISAAQPWDSMANYPVPNAEGGLTGITRGPDGNVWFTEQYADYIGVITPSGAITEYYLTYPVYGPQSITPGSDGALWFTTQSGVIGRITTSGVVTSYALPCCIYALDITPGPDKALWFTTGYGSEIGRITTSGAVTLYGPIQGAYTFGIVAGRDGALWFTNQTGRALGVLQPVAISASTRWKVRAVPSLPRSRAVPTARFGSPSLGRIRSDVSPLKEALSNTSCPPASAS